MVPRYAGASLGLLAFCIATTTGLYVDNPVEVILSRSILALFVFCVVGFVLGGAAQMAIAEYEKQQTSEILKRYREDAEGEAEVQAPPDADSAIAADGDARSTG